MPESYSDAARRAADHGVHSVTPHLVCRDAAAAIDFYDRAFGAEEMIRLPGPDGRLVHACMQINGSSVMLVDENVDCGHASPATLGGTPVSIHLIVEDADATVERAVAAGATVVMPVADMFWGDRFGVIEDPFGHRWSVATPQRDLTESELRDATKEAMTVSAN